jgi:hypothetical protein
MTTESNLMLALKNGLPTFSFPTITEGETNDRND